MSHVFLIYSLKKKFFLIYSLKKKNLSHAELTDISKMHLGIQYLSEDI